MRNQVKKAAALWTILILCMVSTSVVAHDPVDSSSQKEPDTVGSGPAPAGPERLDFVESLLLEMSLESTQQDNICPNKLSVDLEAELAQGGGPNHSPGGAIECQTVADCPCASCACARPIGHPHKHCVCLLQCWDNT